MRSVEQGEFGGPEVLRLVERPRPEPRVNEILVRVHAAGVNPTDWKNRAARGVIGDPPMVLGWDVSGVVVERGFGVTRFKPGDEVFAMMTYPYGHGTHADFVAAPARLFERKPASLDHVESAALPLVSLTAWQALVECADVRPGQRVLVHAGAGGVGHVAIQIAKARGAHVTATSSEPKHAFLRELGADETFDYRSGDFVEAMSDFDVVLDTIGGDHALRSLQVARRGGVVICILPLQGKDFFDRAENLGVRAENLLVDSSHAHLAQIRDFVDDGLLKPTIAEVFDITQAAEAHRAGEAGRTSGKIVLTMV